MSDAPLSNAGSFDAEVVDETIQREWDRFAMPDHSFDPSVHGSRLASEASASTNATNTTRAFDPLPAQSSTTSFGDVFAKAEVSDFVEEDADAPDNVRGAR